MTSTIRLAAPGERGANLYNAYHYLSQLVGLYDQAAGLDHRDLGRAFWEEMSVSVLTDVGELVSVWEAVLKAGLEAGAGAKVGDDPALGVVIVRACRRTERLIGLMTVWTPILKWANVMRLCERRWQVVLDRLMARLDQAAAPHAARIQAVQKASLDRASRLSGRIELYRRERQAMRRPQAAGERCGA